MSASTGASGVQPGVVREPTVAQPESNAAEPAAKVRRSISTPAD
jgi:hypothetical protein